MFFYIGNTRPLTALIQVSETLYLDQGWNFFRVKDVNVWYKGYSTECDLSSKIEDIIDGYQPAGKWCCLVQKDNKIGIKHPIHRGFPLYALDDSITNLKLPNYNFVNFMLSFPEVTSNISLSEASVKIGNILLENIQDFYKYNRVSKMNVLFSGGLDTLTVWSLLDTVTPIYNLDVYIPKKSDNVLAKWSNATSEYESDLIDHVREGYWGYEISRFFSEPNYYITGFYAERHQLREVTNGLAIAHYLKKSINDLLSTTDYLYHFLNRPDIVSKNKNVVSPNFKTEDELKIHMYQSITSDNQMWHLDNNFHFSPLFDKRITDLIVRLSIDDILFNLRHGHIQKEIIKRFRPDFLQLLSDYKNFKDVFGNFKKNWNNVKLNPRTRVTIR